MQLVIALAVTLLGATVALAADVPCGTATAYTAPTATAPGSVTIGASTFVLAAGATSVGAPSGTAPLPPPTGGTGVCINGPRNASGAFTAFSFSPLNAGICGAVLAYVPASASATGSITLTNGTTAPSTLPIAAGVTFSAAQVSGNQCFTLGVDAQGTGRVTGYGGPQVGAPSAAPSTLPSTATEPQAGQLDLGVIWLLVALTALVLVGFFVTRRRQGTTH
jgi:hypothetical protein